MSGARPRPSRPPPLLPIIRECSIGRMGAPLTVAASRRLSNQLGNACAGPADASMLAHTCDKAEPRCGALLGAAAEINLSRGSLRRPSPASLIAEPNQTPVVF